jgi:hypothetical protein
VRCCYESSENAPYFFKIRLNSVRGRRHAVTQLVEALLCKTKGRGFDWNFSLTQPFWQYYGLWSLQPLTEMGSRNIFWGSKGGRCVRLTTLPPSCADYLEIRKPQSPGTLRTYQACTRMDLPFSHILIFFTNSCIDIPNDLFPSRLPTTILYISFFQPNN